MRLDILDRFGRKKKYYLTKEGLEKVREEYETLKKLRLAKLKEDSPKIMHSDEPDAEYLAFKEDLNFLESETKRYEDILKNVELIKPPPKKEQDSIHLGAKVLVEMDGQIEEFFLVGTLEADPSKSKISDESPIGKVLLGKKVGESIELKTPIVKSSCKIIKIKYEGESD